MYFRRSSAVLLRNAASCAELSAYRRILGATLGAVREGKWLPISWKGHQLGHLDFRHSRLLTEGLWCAD
jgi:hypothetical protein